MCKTVVGIDASQFSICQEKPTGIYTRWKIDVEKQCFVPIQHQRRRFENMVTDHLQKTPPDCKIQSNLTGNQHTIKISSVDGFYGHCNMTVIVK